MRLNRRGLVAPAGILVLGIGGVAGLWIMGRPGGIANAGPPAGYVDETAQSGLVHTYDGNFDFAVGGGLAAFDCNDDGRPDLYLAGGERPAQLFRNDSPVGGSLTFSPLPDTGTDLANVNGAYPIDIDGDGHVDLAVLRNGGNRLLRGLGNCRFDDATAAWTLEPGTRHTEAFSATWESGFTWPTLAFGNYVDPLVYNDQTTLDPSRWCEPNVLIRPAAAGPGFGQPIALTPSWCTLSMLFSDWSGSGRVDLRVSNDAHYYGATDGQEQLWRLPPGEPPSLYGADDGWARVRVEGMGIASQDLTGDGRPEIYLTSQAANRLQTLAEGATGPTYADIGPARGVDAAHPFSGADLALPSTGWHPEFADVNNDGLVDLFVSKGNVTRQLDYAIEDPSNLLLGQPDGTFREIADTAGILTFDRGRGAALVDFNLDGRLDLVESFYRAPLRVWRNMTPADEPPAHWLAVRLREAAPNVGAIGAVVEVRAAERTWRTEVTVGGGHASGELGWLHFGLGAAASGEVRVRWPGGDAGPWQHVDADAFVIVDRARGTVERWAPPSL